MPKNIPVEALNDVAHKDLAYRKIPYAKPQPMGMIADLVVPGVMQAVLDPQGGDPRLWVPLSDTVSLRPVHFNVSQGFYAHVMRVTRGLSTAGQISGSGAFTRSHVRAPSVERKMPL